VPVVPDVPTATVPLPPGAAVPAPVLGGIIVDGEELQPTANAHPSSNCRR